MCKNCRPLMQAGVQVLAMALGGFCFQVNALDVYSGQRGIHFLGVL